MVVATRPEHAVGNASQLVCNTASGVPPCRLFHLADLLRKSSSPPLLPKAYLYSFGIGYFAQCSAAF